MKLKNIFLILITLLAISNLNAQVNNHSERKLAIYFPNPGSNTNYIADYSSVKQLADVTGLPHIISSEFMTCLSYGAILFATPVDDGSLNENQKSLLMNYVENGGCVIFSGITDPQLLAFAGIESVEVRRDRHYFDFVSSEGRKELRWIDDENEHELKLGSSTFGDIIDSYGFRLTDGELLAAFRSGEAGLVKIRRGQGLVYSLGLLWRDMIIRNNLDRDYQANRDYSNYFEATSDVIMLLVRGMFTEAIPHTVWISPMPYDSKGVLLITHDVCSHTAQIFANDFAQMEYERGISATYNITTHKFIDDINGDNYTSHIPQMRLLINKNHVIGSHSYGHFPDFASGDIFPLGEKLTSLSEYHAHYSKEENQTIGGTVYGELGISKMLLERDLNINVIMHRSGHLAVNPLQYNVLDELGFLYSSSYTATDILTGFPSYAHYNRAMNGKELPILEMGLAISDVFGSSGSPIDEFNWMDKAKLWTTVTDKFANNNSFTNILIHPNRSYKIDAEVYLLDHMSQDIYPMELTHFGEFWKEKNTVKFSSEILGNILKIYVDNIGLSNDQFTFVIDAPDNIESIEVYNEQNELQDFYQKDYYLGTGLMYQKSFMDIPHKSSAFESSEKILKQNYPNPYSYYTTIEYQVPENAFVNLQIFDLYGRVLRELVHEQKDAGVYQIEVDANKLSSGIYFYQLQIQSGDKYTSATKKMIIK